MFVTASSLVVARGDLTIVQKVESGTSVSQMTIKLKGDKARIEATPQVTTIMDTKSGEMLTLMNDEKKFLRISGEKAKAFAEMVSKYGATAAEKPKLTLTGKKETIGGYETEEYVSEKASFKASYWIALNYPDGAVILKQLQTMVPKDWNEAAKGVPDYRDFPGLPLRTQIKMGGKEITTTITSIKQDGLSEAEFIPPKDFEEMKVPKIETMLGDKPAAPSPTP
ncbi:MAG TPA: DUF4412 domain-containing protein [Chthoniobacterales bacterium]